MGGGELVGKVPSLALQKIRKGRVFLERSEDKPTEVHSKSIVLFENAEALGGGGTPRG